MKIKGFQDTINWYNTNALIYKQATDNAFSQNDKEQLEDFSSMLPNNANVLDAGCGSGRDSNYLQQKHFKVTGLDISTGLIKLAQESYPKIDFVLGDMTRLPFENNSFDGVWSHASLLHMENAEDIIKALNEFKRVLKHKGVLHVLVKAQTTPNKTAVVADKISGHDRFFQYFTKPELEKLISNSGFKIQKIEEYNDTKNNPNGRPEVDWIMTLSEKF